MADELGGINDGEFMLYINNSQSFRNTHNYFLIVDSNVKIVSSGFDYLFFYNSLPHELVLIGLLNTSIKIYIAQARP